jgi:hypothetical protein
VRRSIAAFIERTKPDELILTSQIHDHAARLRSYEIAADLADMQSQSESESMIA